MPAQGKRNKQKAFSIFHLPAAVIDGLQVSDKLNKVRTSTLVEERAAHTNAHYSTPQVDHVQQATMSSFASARLATATCHTCGGIAFESSQEQRTHFKTGWHQINMAKKLQWKRANPHAQHSENEYPWNPIAEQQAVDRSTNEESAPSAADNISSSIDESDSESIWSESDISVVGDDMEEEMRLADDVEGNNSQKGEPAGALELRSYRGVRSTVDADSLAQELESSSSAPKPKPAVSDGEGESDNGRRTGHRRGTPYLWFVSTPNNSAAGPNDSASSAKGKRPEDSSLSTVYGIQRRILIPKGQHNVHVDAHQILCELLKMQLPPPVAKSHVELRMEKLALAQKQKEAKKTLKDDEEMNGSGGPSKLKSMLLPEIDPQTSLWTILSMNGGYFAGAVFDNRTGKMVAHKTFQRYTTRRKQGGSQSKQDGSGGGAAKSAGAQLRRYNERMLQEEALELLNLWKPLLVASTRVFVRLPRTNRKGFFGSGSDASSHVLQWSDPRIRSVPVPMGRPSVAELERVYAEVTTVVVRTVDMSRFDNADGEAQADSAVAAAGDSQEQQLEEQNDDGSVSDHTLEPEPRPDLMAFLYHVAKMMLDESQTDDAIVAYLYDHQGQFLDALGDPAIDLRYLETADMIEAHKTPTLLHLASLLGRVNVVPFLLDNGEDPTITNGYPPMFAGGKTAYEVAKDRKTRDVFRLYRGEHEGEVNGIDWYKARVPDGLTKEKIKENEEKVKMKKQKEKERKKQRELQKKEKKERAKAAEVEDQKALDDAIKTQAEEEKRHSSWKSNVHKMSESELRVRMLSMAYASAGNWGASGTKNGTKSAGPSRKSKSADVPAQRPVSPDTQRAIDRELRFKAYERRMAEQQGAAESLSSAGAASSSAQQYRSTDSCTHCGKSLHGIVPFEQFDWKCCSIDCLHKHQELFG
ncbi:hypothetical protein GGI12_002350 [Dipsacomyces acuminosporus]|nr:hypothetical protein GGI12_002350 [Dipsacomyces acuminosporus]